MFILLATILIWRYLLLMPKFRCLEVCGTWPSKESFTETSLSATSSSPTMMLSRWQTQTQKNTNTKTCCWPTLKLPKIFFTSLSCLPETQKASIENQVEVQICKKQESKFLPTSCDWPANLIFAFNQTATSVKYLHQDSTSKCPPASRSSSE